MKTVIEIVHEYLEANGFDGLYNSEQDCGCELSDLAPCCEIGEDCTAGYKFPCDCGDHDFHIGSAEERDRVLKEREENKMTDKEKYGESLIKEMLDAAGMTPQDFLAACAADRAMFSVELVADVLQRFKLGPPLDSPVRRLAEHVVRLEARLTPVLQNLEVGITTTGQEVVMSPKREEDCDE